MNAPILEREREISAIESAAERAREGRGGLVLVRAGAGFGKTRLLTEARDRLAAGGLPTGFATAREIDRDLPFGLVRELLGPLLRDVDRSGAPAAFEGVAALARPIFEPEATGAVDLGGQLHGLYWLASNLSDGGSLALFVDDAQWADEQSARWLAHLAARVRDLSIAMIVAVRDGEPELDRAPLASLLDVADAALLEPAPLSSAAVRSLVEARLGPAATESFTESCHRVTGGNAFLATELTAALEQDGVEPTDSAVDEVVSHSPANVNRRLTRRIAREGPEAVELTEALAVLGDGTPAERVYDLAGVDHAVGAALLDRLDRRELVGSGARPGFPHPLVREAVLRRIGQSRLALLHRRAIEVCEEAGAPPERVVPHLLMADPADAEAGIATLIAAATAAEAQGAPGTARELLDRAVEIAGEDSDPALRLLHAKAHGRANSDRAASLLLAESEVHPDPWQAIVLKIDAARARYSAGAWPEAIGLLESAIGQAEGTDRELALVARSILVGILLFVPGTDRSSLKAHGIALDYPGDTPGERALLAARAAQLMMDVEGRAEDAAEIARRAWADGRLLDDEGPGGITWSFATGALAAADRYREDEELLSQVLDAARRSGSSHAFASASYCRACPRLFRGAIKESLADAEAAIAARDDGWELYYPLSLVVAARCRIELGETDEAERTLGLVSEESGALGTLMALTWNLARCDLALEANDVPRAESLLRRIESDSGGHRSPFALSDHLTSAAAVERRKGRTRQAVELLEEQLDLVRPWGAPRLIGSTLRDLALTVRGEGGLGLAEEAVSVLRDSEVRLGLGYALVARGELLREAGHKEDAERTQFEALEVAADTGSLRLEARARSELGLLGRRPRRTRRTGLDALTASEQRVARRAAYGMTNREIAQELFVSVKTVEKHLANTYPKLGIASRRELAAKLGEPSP